MLYLVIGLLLTGWVAAAIIGTQAYFRGEQTKPIHERNIKSASFERIAEIFTGNSMDHAERVYVYSIDSYRSNNLDNR